MFRRCISLLVIVGLFASQLAAVPHAHVGISLEELQKHDATPHFHCSWLCHDDHGHDHSHGGHSHQHESPLKPVKQSADEPLPDGVAVLNHNANAVYAPTHASAVAAGKQQDIPTSSLVLAAVCASQAYIPAIDWDKVSRHGHPPDAVLDGSDTYLTLRNLRI
jgi:hypothetical protein